MDCVSEYVDTGKGNPYILPISDAVSLATGRRQMSNNWTENMAARDAAFRAGKQAHASGTDVAPEKFSTQDLRAHFLRGYDIAAWKAARAAKQLSST